MNWKRLSIGPIGTNCYVIYNKENKALIVDPGGEDEELFQLLETESLNVEAVLLTHAHYDHIGGVDAVRKKFDCPVYVHENEAKWLGDPQSNGSGWFPDGKLLEVKPADHYFSVEGEVQVGSFTCKLFETPGHSPGSVSFYFPKDKVVFSGDVLFRGGVGRTDLPKGDQDTLMNTIHDKMLTLPDDTVVANGHGPETTIGEEKETNPFINGFGW